MQNAVDTVDANGITEKKEKKNEIRINYRRTLVQLLQLVFSQDVIEFPNKWIR